jgi:cobalt-zinc-cadmium efflux system outer membrane protein
MDSGFAIVLLLCSATVGHATTLDNLATKRPLSAVTTANIGSEIENGNPQEHTIRLVNFQNDDESYNRPVLAAPQSSSDLSSEIASVGESNTVLPTENSATLAQIEQTAVAFNPAVMEARANIDALRGKHTQAGLPPNPTLGVIGDDINEEGSGGRYGVYFGREIVRGNKLGLSQSVVCAEIETAQQRLAVIEQKLLTDVRKRYYDLLVSQEKVIVSKEIVKILQDVADVSQKLLDAKEVAKSAILQSNLELQNAIVIQRQAENERLAARRKLAAFLGEEQLAYDEVTGDARKLPELNEFQQAFDHLVHASPEIAALFAEVEQARRQLARAKVEPIPNVTWQTTLQYGTGSEDVVAGFQVGMPIPRVNRNQGAIYQAQQQIRVAERRAEKRMLDLRLRLASSYESYQNAKLQLDAFDAEILPTAKESFELISQGYQAGEVDFLQLLTAQRTYSQAALQYLEKLRQAWQQSVEIQGMLLSGSLE